MRSNATALLPFVILWVPTLGYIHTRASDLMIYLIHEFLLLLLPFVLQGIDVQSMGRIFIGLVKCGAWGCFDEFNRLEEAVLSAVSMQIQTIQAAIKTKQESCQLLGREVSA